MSDQHSRTFPADFLFGAATAAYQVEGAAREDGRTDSIWDAFSRVPGAVIHAENGDVACDHYHRYHEDVSLMSELGLQTYRFSTSWSRVRPDGDKANPKGLDFYSRLVDQLLAEGIKPWLTLYHWDLPQKIEDVGGWTNRDTAQRFLEYSLDVYDALGDRVHAWTTLNEPWCSAFLGYTGGQHAPGRQDVKAGLAAAHHLLLAHGLAVNALRERKPQLELGITLSLNVVDPLDPASPDDVDAARRVDGQYNRIFLDPLFRGAYPADVRLEVGPLGLDAVIQPGDLDIISTSIDFLGINYYCGELVSKQPAAGIAQGSAPTSRRTRSPFPATEGIHHHPQARPLTEMGWPVQPEGLTGVLARVHREYTAPANVQIYVTENGAAYDDTVSADGAVHDGARLDFINQPLNATLDAMDEGVPVMGFFYWSLLDNFEWAWGYDKRFGIIRVDYDTQQRTVKDSGLRYAQIIRDRAIEGTQTLGL